MLPYEKIASTLRADKDTIKILEEKMSAATGKKGVMDKIIEENQSLMTKRLDFMGLTMSAGAKEIYEALISKIESDNNKLFELLGHPSSGDEGCCENMLRRAKQAVNPPTGFFMKIEKAKELLRSEPPKKVMEMLGYSSVDDMISHEDVFEIFAALRFVEGSDWLNNVFFKQYESLKPEDFEFREITVKGLGKRWVTASEGFVKKKYHNLSHLKELGFIFALPVTLGISGELLRGFSLTLHYVNEITFYSRLFAKYAEQDPDSFSKNIVSLLRGDTIDSRVESDKIVWLVIPRYFAKDDEHDWRLFEPHINPEALHWEKAERALNTLPIDFSFWCDLNWVGGEFPTTVGIDVLVSFNLVDTVMSLVKEKEMIKYLYHHQEALWNKVYSEYLSEGDMEAAMRDNLLKGYLEI